MKIAVILCTYNRCRTLARALESLAATRMPDSQDWRVVVVDNNSTDLTRSVVEDFIARFPGRFEYLFQPRQGKSQALNLGIQHSRADILAFTDDDVQVDPNWLQRIAAPFQDPNLAGVGGRILPEAGFAPPAWLDTTSRYSLAPLAMFDLAMPAAMIQEPPFGANMAYRSELFAKYGGFRLDLGPQPGGEIKNEDMEFGSRILNAGERIWYEPEAIVYHELPHHRIKKGYFRWWWYGKARSDVRQFGYPQETGPTMFGVPVSFFRRLVTWSLRSLFTFDPVRRFNCQLNAWGAAGRIHEAFVQTRKAARVRISQPQSTP